MQAYSSDFARIYNEKWASYARSVAPALLEFSEKNSKDSSPRQILDLCCGSGQLALHFLDHGYTVHGIDLSEGMLEHAIAKTRQYVESGRATFTCANAANFRLTARFPLVVSTYDSLNHLHDDDELRHCFRAVYDVCDGYFLFDLNTRKGLHRWNGAQVFDSDRNSFVATKGLFDGVSHKAEMTVTWFQQEEGGLYRRYDESVFNSVFEMRRVRELLLSVGWKEVYFADIQELQTPIADPEELGRVWVVARK